MGKCIICGRKLKKYIYKMENMPSLVQHMPLQGELEKDKAMELRLYQCDGCGLVQFDCEAVYYYKDVIRAGGCSSTLRELRKEQYRHLLDTYHLEGKSIWEVGCGKGEFLEIWKDFPVNIYGTENNVELVKEAKEKGLDVYQGFVDDKYFDERGSFDAFISFNYLEHQPNPNEMIQGIYENLSEGGIGLVTVPSFEYFIENASYYEFMRDHIAYYTESALRILFELNGFEVLEMERFNGDTTQVIVKKREKTDLPDFDGQKNNIERKINRYISEHGIEKNKIAVWGASHQGLTILATTKLDAEIKYIVDSADFKWGRYSPVSHYPIVSPEILWNDDIELVIIMAPAFSDEISNIIKKNTSKIKHILAVKGDEVLDK